MVEQKAPVLEEAIEQKAVSFDQVSQLITATLGKFEPIETLTLVTDTDPRSIKTQRHVVLMHDGRMVSIIDTLVQDRVGSSLVPNRELSHISFEEIVTKHTRPIELGVSIEIPRAIEDITDEALEKLKGIKDGDINRLLTTVAKWNDISPLRFPEAKAQLLGVPITQTRILPGARLDIGVRNVDSLPYIPSNTMGSRKKVE